jgi:ureidoacrylate peracid hydrolase
MKKLQNLFINRENAILVIVDVENEFCKPGGKLFTRTAEKIAPGVFSNIRVLAEKARQAQVPVIYIQSMRTLREAEFTVYKRLPTLEQGTWSSEICEEVKPQKGDIVIPKFCHDPFLRPDLDTVLKRLVPEPARCYAIITGGAINICVYQTVMGFHEREYWTAVVLDSVYYTDDESYRNAVAQYSISGAFPNIFLTRSDLIVFSENPQLLEQRPEPGT